MREAHQRPGRAQEVAPPSAALCENAAHDEPQHESDQGEGSPVGNLQEPPRRCADDSLGVGEVAERAGFDKKIHPHTLRHSYAINYLMKGGNLRNLQLNLGHSDLNITAQYLQVTVQDRKNEYDIIISD